ncbi:hypothetical protein JCM30760_27020 [Thiomicrorhabdus hydrogeniphila]
MKTTTILNAEKLVTINPYKAEDEAKQALLNSYKDIQALTDKFESLPKDVKVFLEEVFKTATHERQVVTAVDAEFEGKTVEVVSPKGGMYLSTGYSKIADYAVEEFNARLTVH